MVIPWIVELHAPHLLQPLRLFIKDRVVIGRNTDNPAEQPDVDLGKADTPNHPVSPRHAALINYEGQLLVCDLDSHCGTFLNGSALNPDALYPIANGDLLQLGRMSLRLSVILSPSTGSGMHYRAGLNLHDQTLPGRDQIILIVESDAEVARVLAQIMENAGYTTLINQDVVSAVRTFMQKQPSAAVVDLNLPDIDGLEFCHYVRRDLLYNTMPIVLLNDKPQAAADLLQAGASIVLDKPLSALDLSQVVVALVNQHDNGVQTIRTKRLAHVTPFEVFPPDRRRQGAVLFVESFNEPIILDGFQMVSFGRTPGTSSLGSQQHIDLTRFNAANCGVSRIHMFLHQKDSGFFIEDVGSRNYTYLNGKRLEAHKLTPVRNGDEIRLGLLRLYIYLFEDQKAPDETA